MSTTADIQKAVLSRVARRVRAMRLSKGLTQEAAAGRAGLAPRHFQKIEAAEVNVTLKTLARIAAALGVDVGELLQEPDHEQATDRLPI
jgi:transcriptional regulator with XRE-family HTH domain